MHPLLVISGFMIAPMMLGAATTHVSVYLYYRRSRDRLIWLRPWLPWQLLTRLEYSLNRVGVTLFLAALMIGVTCLAADRVYAMGQTRGLATHGALQAFEKVQVLRLLRRGETAKAIASLEASLDTNIIESSSADKDVLLGSTLAVSRLMSHVADYRDEYRTAQRDAEIRSLIQRTLKKNPPLKCPPSNSAAGAQPSETHAP
jgi:hypothetical protein